MADYEGSFSGSFTGSYDISTNTNEYTGATYGYVLHQRSGVGYAEKISLSNFFRNWLGSESGSAGIQDYNANGYINDSDRILIRSGSYVGSAFTPIIKTATISNLFGGYSNNASLRNTFVYARGVGRNTETITSVSSSMVLTIGGKVIYDNGISPGNQKGLTLTIVDGNNFDVVATTRYNTVDSAAESTTLASAINNIKTTEFGIITSLGYWEVNINDDLRTAAMKVGLTKLGGYNSSDSGSAYSAVFYGTSGSAGVGDSLERLVSYRFTTGSEDDIPTSTITTRIQSNGQGPYPFINISDASSTNALYAFNANTASVLTPALFVDSEGNISASGIISASSFVGSGIGGGGAGGPFYETGSFWATTNEIQITGSLKVTSDSIINTLTIGTGSGDSTNNTALGYQTLLVNDTGVGNTALGYRALYSNIDGYYNTAVGYRALLSNAHPWATDNTAVGFETLRNNTSGSGNTAIGGESLSYNTIGAYNSAIGYWAMINNRVGDNNVGIGVQAMYENRSGSNNVAIGNDVFYDMRDATTNSNNTIIGYNTGRGIVTGSANTIIGAQVTGLPTSLSNTIIIADGQGNYGLYISSSRNAQFYGDVVTSGDVTASAFIGDGSQITGVVSSSYAVTASYVDGASITGVVSSSYAETASHVDNSFLELNDTPTTYTGSGGYLLTVDLSENSVTFTNEIGIDELILEATTAPTSVASDSVSMYVTATGTTPNREVAYKIKNELGQEIIISSILV